MNTDRRAGSNTRWPVVAALTCTAAAGFWLFTRATLDGNTQPAAERAALGLLAALTLVACITAMPLGNRAGMGAIWRQSVLLTLVPWPLLILMVRMSELAITPLLLAQAGIAGIFLIGGWLGRALPGNLAPLWRSAAITTWQAITAVWLTHWLSGWFWQAAL